MRTERLHHVRKGILSKDDGGWSKLSGSDKTFIRSCIDCCGGKLNTGKWNKLFAILAALNNKSHKNYRVYLSAQGFYFDTTNHTLTTKQALDAEPTHQDVEFGLRGPDAQLQRLELEHEQLGVKIEQMSDRRIEIGARIKQMKEANDGNR